MTALLKIFFDLLYHQMAWTYDWVAAIVSVGLWKDWVLSVVDDMTGSHVGELTLELGHGPGHLQFALAEKNLKVAGLDKSIQMSQQASKRLIRQGRIPSIANGLGQQMPFRDGAFHQLVATFPSEYIFELGTLTEIYRVLKPEGKLVMLPVAWIIGQKPIERAAAWLFRVTGQSPKVQDSLEARLLKPIRTVGFQVQVQRRSFKSSSLIVLIAQKLPVLGDDTEK